MSLVAALVTSKLSEITRSDRDLIARTLMDLHSRGFSVEEAKKTLRRIRNREVEPGDREGEPAEPTGTPLRFASDMSPDLPF